MLRISFLLVFLVSYAFCADHETYKNCSGVSFCKDFRDSKPTSPLTAQLDKITENKDSIIIPISNTDKQQFNIHVTILSKSTIRIKILENNSKRYELADVLDKEPTKLDVATNKSIEGSVIIQPKDSSYSHTVTVDADPLKIRFYDDSGLLVSVFNGDQLIFDKDSQSFAFNVEFVEAIKLYGLHHHTVNLELPDTKMSKMDPLRLRNSDLAYYEIGSPMAMYGAVPVVYGHTGKYTSGIFLHNAAEQWVDVSYYDPSASVKFMVESAALDLFVFTGSTAKDVVRQFVEITGRAHMPQLWTLGYHQCRWSYFTQEDAKEVVAQMDVHDLPMDALWLDIDYTNGYRYFTWNPENFSDPIGFQKNLSSTNRKLVTILDPHIKIDPDYPVYANAKNKYFVKWENGSDFEGSCWPNVSSYIDFLDPEARDYYASWYSYDKFKDTTPTLAGVWNDMNEPSVFDKSTENTMPFELIHHGKVKHRDIHNIYGFLQTKATHQGLMQRDNGTRRPFVLTRSHFAGSQRYAAMWTGDNTADWPYMRVSYSECMLSNLVGLVFCGADVGGFFNNPEVELVERWYQAGVWLPFYRGHAHIDTQRREPYLYESNVQTVIRNALRTRYQHVPVWYTLFYEHTRTGDPVIRPLFYEYPGIVDKDNHILLGSDILARPVMDKGADIIDVTFPGEKDVYWYRIDGDSNTIHSGSNTTNFTVDIATSPYFYRGGSIIARKDIIRRSTTDTFNDPFSLYINLDSENKAVGRLYVDDYTSFDYQNKNLYCYLNMTYLNESGGIQIHQIDGISTNITVDIDHIIVNRKTPSGDTYTRTEIRTLADGTPLSDFKLVHRLQEEKQVFLRF